ncbi:MAG: glycosyltransferase, partial [Ferruginibacter sp.]|nr:glycosyltransferase [Ferruginibacter sp.]
WGGGLEKQLDDRVKLIYLEKYGRWDILLFLWRLYRVLKELQPKVLHGYLSTQNLLTILFKPFFPSTRMFWGIRATKVDFSRYSWLAAFLFKLECFFSRFADVIIVNSEAGYKYHLLQGFSEDKMVVVNNGIDTNLFKIDLNSRTKVRSEWQVLPETILIGLVGRLDPMKDHPNFLQAAALLSKNNQNLCFACIGNGGENYTQKLHQLAAQLAIADKVKWVGKRADMLEVYNAFDIVVSSSCDGEGFANAIAEAMTCGIPCVVTDIGDSALIVGDTGVVVPPKNPQALAEATSNLIDLSNSKRVVLGKMARARIINNFSVNKLVETTTAYLIKQQN